MDPRTFLPPRALATRPAPAPGDAARPLPLALDPERPAVVAFLRHTGCPFAERTLQLLREEAERAPQVQWIAITHAPEQATERWCRAAGGAGEVILASDPSRRAYADWGLGRTNLAHFMGRRSLGAAVTLARKGIRNRHPHGTRWQSAGTFAVDRGGVVRWTALPSHAGDLPDLAEAVRSLHPA